MFPDNKLVLATRNAGKVAEMESLLEGHGILVTSAAALDLPEVEETGDTFEANALLKAQSAVKASGLAVLADDSGLSADAIGGAPGVYSADWGGPERDFSLAMARLEREVRDAGDNRSAGFVSVLILLWPDGRQIMTRGEVRGHLVFPPRGAGGFGYDPCFVPEGDECTFAEMPPLDKAKFSHRSRAMEKLLTELFA
ncbi:MAG: RdgB/HAM1 family non-canonical purine NTP pyrophosphatase [Pseudomonadota bacterium]